jgi:hypothetical protein
MATTPVPTGLFLEINMTPDTAGTPDAWDIEAANVEDLRRAAVPVAVLLAHDDWSDFPIVDLPPISIPGQIVKLSDLLAAGAASDAPTSTPVPLVTVDPATLPPGHPFADVLRADLIFGFDTVTKEGRVFFGLDFLAHMRDRGRLLPPEERKAHLVTYALDCASDDLPRLRRLITRLRGACCHSINQITIQCWWPNWST